MVVSAPDADVLDVSQFAGAGAVYVYERPAADAQWQLTARVVSPTPVTGAQFGDAVALEGDRLAVATSGRLSGSTGSGVVNVFQRQPDGAWSRLGTPLTIGGSNDDFGAELAWVTTDRLLVGAPGAVGTSDSNAAIDGEIWDATWTAGSWNMAAIDVASLFTTFGTGGQEFGFAFDVDERPGGGYSLVAGMPGLGDDGGAFVFNAGPTGPFSFAQAFTGGAGAGARAGDEHRRGRRSVRDCDTAWRLERIGRVVSTLRCNMGCQQRPVGCERRAQQRRGQPVRPPTWRSTATRS